MERLPVSGLITPIFTNDEYPIIDPRFGIDGMRSLDKFSDMLNLPLEKRRGGMVVAIPNTSSNNAQYYALKPEGNGVTWSLGMTSNWYGFLSSATGSNAIPIKYSISSETITVPLNYEYLIWGNMQIGNSGSFVNDGKTYIINGTLSVVGDGTYSGVGSYNFITVPTKYRETFNCGPNGATINHNLGTQDITYSVRDNLNFINVNVEIVNSNSIIVKSISSFSNASITIIG